MYCRNKGAKPLAGRKVHSVHLEEEGASKRTRLDLSFQILILYFFSVVCTNAKYLVDDGAAF